MMLKQFPNNKAETQTIIITVLLIIIVGIILLTLFKGQVDVFKNILGLK